MLKCKGCGLIHREQDFSCQEAEQHRKNLDLARLRSALKWALGEGATFGPRPQTAGPYWWRTELRKRAGKALHEHGHP